MDFWMLNVLVIVLAMVGIFYANKFLTSDTFVIVENSTNAYIVEQFLNDDEYKSVWEDFQSFHIQKDVLGQNRNDSFTPQWRQRCMTNLSGFQKRFNSGWDTVSLFAQTNDEERKNLPSLPLLKIRAKEIETLFFATRSLLPIRHPQETRVESARCPFQY